MRKPFSLLSVILAALIAMFFSATVFSQDAEIPEDFSVAFTSRPMLVSGDIDIETLTIAADGEVTLSPKVWYSGMIPDITRQELPEITISLDGEALGEIYDAISENEFFSLEPYYEDPMIVDGDLAELTITANGQTHTVTTRNIKVNAFDRITVTINSHLPEERRLLYNAINGAGYEEVER